MDLDLSQSLPKGIPKMQELITQKGMSEEEAAYRAALWTIMGEKALTAPVAQLSLLLSNYSC